MKRILTIYSLISAIVILHGCSFGDDMVKTHANIGFNPVIGHDTRADESVPFPKDRNFNVWALDCSNGNIVINKENIDYGTDGWISATKWPETELEFTAYWPVNLNPEYNKEKGIIIKDFSDEDTDLLVAREKAVYGSDTLIPLHFQHILSRLEFRVRCTLEEHIEFKLTKIELKGYSKKGSYNLNGNGFWETDDANNSKVIYDSEQGASFNISREAQYIGDDFLTIPQICKGTVTVHFMIKIGDGEWIYDSLTTKPLDTEWESGKLYTYTLIITDAKLTFTTGISNWNNRE